jgi:cephalosporin-C deacetylase-like acetyl esterase
MTLQLPHVFAALSAAVAIALPRSAQGRKYDGTVELDHPDGFYKSGETVHCKVLLKKYGKALKGARARLVLKWELEVIESKEFETTGAPVEFTYASDKPGWVYFGFEVLGEDGKPLSGPGVCKLSRKPTIVTEIGALFDADKIATVVRDPADFDEFWAKRIAEVHAAPLKPELTELDSKVEGVKLFAVSLPVVRGIKASGYLAFPAGAKPKSLPAQISFQSMTHGDVGVKEAVKPAKSGALAFAVTWHGLPVGLEDQFYKTEIPKCFDGGARNIGDRDNWEYADVFFRVIRELEFLKSRPEWDGRTLITYGGSLGGILSAFAAAMDKDVSLAVISVPSFCECNAFEAGRSPHGVYRRKVPVEKLKADPGLVEGGFYYDAVNFGRRLTCETYVCTGFTDESCCPSNVFAFFNAIPATTKKTMTTNPRTGHFGTTKEIKGDSRIAEIFRGTTIGEQPRN